MRVAIGTALAAAFLFTVPATVLRADVEPQASASASEPAAAQNKSEARAPDSAAVVAQAPVDPDAQVLADIKVYPCF
jgi:hypothetical protein